MRSGNPGPGERRGDPHRDPQRDPLLPEQARGLYSRYRRVSRWRRTPGALRPRALSAQAGFWRDQRELRLCAIAGAGGGAGITWLADDEPRLRLCDGVNPAECRNDV